MLVIRSYCTDRRLSVLEGGRMVALSSPAPRDTEIIQVRLHIYPCVIYLKYPMVSVSAPLVFAILRNR